MNAIRYYQEYNAGERCNPNQKYNHAHQVHDGIKDGCCSTAWAISTRLSECGEEGERVAERSAWDLNRQGRAMANSPRGVIFSCPGTERLIVRHLRRS
jgi:hypothetical protein